LFIFLFYRGGMPTRKWRINVPIPDELVGAVKARAKDLRRKPTAYVLLLIEDDIAANPQTKPPTPTSTTTAFSPGLVALKSAAESNAPAPPAHQIAGNRRTAKHGRKKRQSPPPTG
jgi:hypothetical protein